MRIVSQPGLIRLVNLKFGMFSMIQLISWVDPAKFDKKPGYNLLIFIFFFY
jgi:hypothetical protein